MSEKPRYLRIAEELAARIGAGEPAVGALLPTERELCRRYRVSRHTARAALDRLEQRGLVERRQGSGTRVKAQRSPVQYQQFVQSLEELLQYGPTTRLVVRRARRGRPPALVQRMLGGEGLIHVSGQRFERGAQRPFALTEIYVVPRRATDERALLDLDASVAALIDLFDVRRLRRVEQQLSAESLAPAQALALGLAPGAAALVATRVYYSDGARPFAMAITAHAGSRFAYRSVLARDVD